MKKIFNFLNWIYKFNSYNLWNYRDGKSVLTKDYIFLGKPKQKEVKGSESYFAIMMFGDYVKHDNCE